MRHDLVLWLVVAVGRWWALVVVHRGWATGGRRWRRGWPLRRVPCLHAHRRHPWRRRWRRRRHGTAHRWRRPGILWDGGWWGWRQCLLLLLLLLLLLRLRVLRVAALGRGTCSGGVYRGQGIVLSRLRRQKTLSSRSVPLAPLGVLFECIVDRQRLVEQKLVCERLDGCVSRFERVKGHETITL